MNLLILDLRFGCVYSRQMVGLMTLKAKISKGSVLLKINYLEISEFKFHAIVPKRPLFN